MYAETKVITIQRDLNKQNLNHHWTCRKFHGEKYTLKNLTVIFSPLPNFTVKECRTDQPYESKFTSFTPQTSRWKITSRSKELFLKWGNPQIPRNRSLQISLHLLKHLSQQSFTGSFNANFIASLTASFEQIAYVPIGMYGWSEDSCTTEGFWER